MFEFRATTTQVTHFYVSVNFRQPGQLAQADPVLFIAGGKPSTWFPPGGPLELDSDLRSSGIFSQKKMSTERHFLGFQNLSKSNSGNRVYCI